MSSGGGIETSPTISETSPQKAAAAKNRIVSGQNSFLINLQYFLRAAASMKFRRGNCRKRSGARPAICRLRGRGGVFAPEIGLSKFSLCSALAAGWARGNFWRAARGKGEIRGKTRPVFLFPLTWRDRGIFLFDEILLRTANRRLHRIECAQTRARFCKTATLSREFRGILFCFIECG